MTMKAFNYQHHSKLTDFKTNDNTYSAWQSTDSPDKQWDDFLASSPYSHFYQSSMWGEVRKLDGWQPLITIITQNDAIVGGFQMLWRSKRFLGKIGLVLKGPVAATDDPVVLNFTLAALKITAQINDIRALIVQPPDRDPKTPDTLKKSGFSACDLGSSIKNNTVAIDLNQEEETIFKAMKHNKRKNIKTALREGVHVREGSANDINTFFNYMVETCKRQQVKPSPAGIHFLEKMWALFSHYGNIKLFFSTHQDRNLSAIMVILFGQTAYLWKFGWSGNSGHCRPNEILYFHIFKWAKANNYRFADMGAIDSEIANKILNNESVPEEMTKSYSFFKAGFGGNIVSLSKGFVFIPNPILRITYNLLMPYIKSNRILTKIIERAE